MAAKLGILAGGGALPRRLIKLCHETGREVFLVAFMGQTDPETTVGVDHLWTRLGAAGQIIKRLQAEQVRELVMVGPIKRPSMAELRPDWRAVQFFAKIGAKSLGDDSLLRSVITALEEEGFLFRGVDDLLQDLIAPEGIYGSSVPDVQAYSDIRRGVEVAKAMGKADVGQSVVVQQGLVLGVEAIEGTDALLTRCGLLRREGAGGVLVKLKKPEQERRADLPTIGIETLRRAAESGLRGVAIEAGGALVVDREALCREADQLGLFVLGISPSDYE
ncbi:UDP-2,3-diacylglucosamine diphosphatase LpxI [Kiloniella laminariae]|uniref:UDP-2,3-diacylglucosamine diphosphatase LpxI n=1 Tax=Kiloniella laminariae TaxID=454162 RepID=A0ABT4LLP5_9PROT|nr:UDP-2,3-diacylglucosamine diphosphatase LpxI [Kiloniella laminariae]MCZ4282035.1 UDP-2,3-diacylglucosamine diphosphatase LpxI [Kiloniella laminariae]